MSNWISVKDKLPECSAQWNRYIVYAEEFVMTATYDGEQKIWHLDCDEQLNALIDIEDAPLNGDYVIYWMPLPEPPEED